MTHKQWVAVDLANWQCAKFCEAVGESALKNCMKSVNHLAYGKSKVQSNLIKNYVTGAVGEQQESVEPSTSLYLRHACTVHELVMDAEVLWTL